MKYLVAIDGSHSAHIAFLQALQMINKEKDELMLLLVIEKMTTKYPIIMSALPVLTDAQKELEEQCAVLLNNYGHICEQEKVLHFKLLSCVSNQPGKVIVETAEQRKADVIFVGRRGMNAAKRLFLGSTSKYVVENAPCNVFVIRETEDQATPNPVLNAEKSPKLHLIEQMEV